MSKEKNEEYDKLRIEEMTSIIAEIEILQGLIRYNIDRLEKLRVR